MDALLMLAEAGGTPTMTQADVIGTVADRADGFLGLVTKIGDIAVNNEICIAFLTVTFMGLGVKMLRRIIGAFGRGR